MYLTERPQTHPLDKNHIGALNPKASIHAIKENKHEDEVSFIPIDMDLAKVVGEFAFTLRMHDDSMEPELKKMIYLWGMG